MNLRFAREVLDIEARAIAGLAQRLDERFLAAAALLLECKGRVVVCGMGKPGIIGQKISATLASTGTPSYALHPAEALHGDLGRVRKEDVLLVLSNSGETDEIVRLIPHVKKIGAKVVGLTSKKDSTLGRHSDICLDMGPIEEACPHGLAPTASTTAMLALGDALALAVQQGRSFSHEEFAMFHPGGSLGRRFLRVEEIMRKGARCVTIGRGATVRDAIVAITEARTGAASIVDEEGRLLGIFTDGDLRRHLAREPNVAAARVESVMTRSPTAIAPDRLAVEAMRIMGERKFNQLPVVDAERRPIGILDAQDLLAVGLVS